jgi:hypothetical protein
MRQKDTFISKNRNTIIYLVYNFCYYLLKYIQLVYLVKNEQYSTQI